MREHRAQRTVLEAVALAAMIALAGCGGSSSSMSGGSSSVDPNNQAALSNALTITSSSAPTGTGTMTKFLYPASYFVTNVIYSSPDLGMPTTPQVAQGGMTSTLTLNPTGVSGLILYCDVGSASTYSYWVPSATQGDTVAGTPLTVTITWPAFSNAGTFNFRCFGSTSLGDAPGLSGSEAEMTPFTAMP